PLYVSARGLTTSLMHAGTTGLEIEFDFVDGVLALRHSNGQSRAVALEPGSVADFYGATKSALDELGAHPRIWDHPVETQVSVPFSADLVRRAYDGEAARRYWTALVSMHRVMGRFRSAFVGKSSPVHYFWGGGDMAVTRFSGRRAPRHPGGVPNCPDWVQELAYSHEVASCGYWPGGASEGAFYAYAYPEPEGFADAPISPEAAYYDRQLKELLLPYEAVRMATDPEAVLLSFFESSYAAAADLAGWDRANLEAHWRGPEAARA
ncbi:MAG: Uncharacterized protein JWM85_582, partial [Acidimicrobiaceae bacterium]|nr:Uncharacterized protein [Acidimicrobiaceae bacterium]